MSDEVRSVAASDNQFGLDLYARLRDGKADNLFCSPSSLATALAMVHAGARGETAEEMARALHFHLPPEKLHPAIGDLLATWTAADKEPGFQLSVANRLWGQKGSHFMPEYLELTRAHYGAELAEVDFLHRAEPAREQINAWVEKKTEGKIRDLIARGALGASTRLVLTNAIYFKGTWSEPFKKEATQTAPFHVSATRKVDVPLMYQSKRFRCWEGDGLKALALPYKGGSLSMLVLLPDAIDQLPELEAKLTTENLALWRSKLAPRQANVHLPRFQLTAEFELSQMLRSMGMARAFTRGQADLSGMSSEEELYLSAVVHKAFVDVNEEGTEAAAATAIGVKTAAVFNPARPLEFRADHPFVFLIQDDRTGAVLFLGRLIEP